MHNHSAHSTDQQDGGNRAEQKTVPHRPSRKQSNYRSAECMPRYVDLQSSPNGQASSKAPNIRRLCVYCGSSAAVDQCYRDAATELGARLAASGIGLVYGGGRVGLMGLLADAALAAGGEVVGIIPARLRDAELAHSGASELVIVDSMHERKRLMAERADAFAVLPGGIGTLDELFDTLSWKQLGLHKKPIIVVDILGYWAPLRALLGHIVGSGFARPETSELFRVVPTITALMASLVAEPAQSWRVDRVLP
jgi:uncharacterized protein (TIGR00730 family)